MGSSPSVTRYHRPATVADAYFVAKYMREEDTAEWWAATGRSPFALLLEIVRERSVETIVDPTGTPIGLCGVTLVPNSSTGYVWMCGTDRVKLYPRLFITEGRKWLSRWHQARPFLQNMVDARNTLHVRWLALMGFRFTGIVHPPASGLPFITFERTV